MILLRWVPGIVLGIVLVSSPIAANERILSFHSDITVKEDGTLMVTETIRVVCEGMRIQRGIYRDFPTIYYSNWVMRKTVPFEVEAVKRDGKPDEYHLEQLSNGTRVYIGQKNYRLPLGEYTYQLTYRTDDQVGFFSDHDEIYWNATGNGWAFEMEAVTATVTLPVTVEAGDVLHEAYTGVKGATGREYTSALAPKSRVVRVNFATRRNLHPFEGLTVVVSWPKGHVREPAWYERLSHFVRDNPGLVLVLIAYLIVPAYYYRAWHRYGRDPKRGTIIPEYSPADGLSPAAARYLRQMGFDDRCVAASVLNLAAKGHLSVHFNEGVYSIKRVVGKAMAVPAEEYAILQVIGKRRFYFQGENHAQVWDIRRRIKGALEHQFGKGYFRTNRKYLYRGLLISALAVPCFLAVIVMGLLPLAGFTLLLALIVFLIVLAFLFEWLLKAYTKQGRALMDRIEGFRMYLGVAEQERLELLHTPEKTPELFEKFLPYALALGVENRWAEKFAQVLPKVGRANSEAYSPGWYQSAGELRFDLLNFTHSMSAFSGAITSASIDPAPISSSDYSPGSSSGSSSYSSSSSGSSGGSSGGGGGGGGGGGW